MHRDAGACGSRPPLSLESLGWSAYMVLQNRMAEGDITSTESLVEKLNASQTPEDRPLQEWVRAYIKWFNREPIGNLDHEEGIAIKEYSLLAGIQPDSDAQKRILREYFDSLHRKFQEDSLGSTFLIEALEYTLQTMDSAVFEGNPTSLFQLGNVFFAKLDPTMIMFTKAAYPTHRSPLYALHQTLILIQEVAPGQLDLKQGDGLYRRIKSKVQAIAESAQWYPICYHAHLLEQSLQRLASGEDRARFQDRLRRAGMGLKGIIHFYNGVKALATLDFDIGSFESGCESWKAAFTSHHIESKPWYDWHQAMQHACLLNLEDPDQYHVFCKCLQAVEEKEVSMRKTSDRKALRFGLVQQLCLLSMEGANAEVRKASVEKLASLAECCSIADGKCWLEDLDILEELMEGLAAIAAHSRHEKEKEVAEVALEILTSRPLGAKGKRAAAMQEAIRGWLGGQTVEEKLSTLVAPGPVFGGLFVEINRRLRLDPREALQAPQVPRAQHLNLGAISEDCPSPAAVQEACQALRDHYQHNDFARVRSLFDGQAPKHVDSLQCQLMLLELAKVKAGKKDGEPQDGLQGATKDHLRVQGRTKDHLATHYERLIQVKTPIALEEIFHDRSKKPGEPAHKIHKVLLVGNPGTGKTTLSRMLAYRWAQGTWGQVFEAVYVLPVRALQQSLYDNVSFRRDETLANAIVRNCFAPREEDGYKRLRHQITLMLNKPTTLVVLDGMDERYGASEKLLNQAKSGRHKLLILSRPYGIEAERFLADIEIEHAGLNDAQMKEFITHEISPQSGATLQAFIREQPAIALIAHVPVNLQILCALWEWQGQGEGGGVDAVPVNGSLAGLYHRLTWYVWHRYKEKHREQHLQYQDHEALFAALGRIAVRGLECGEVSLSQGLVDGVLEEEDDRVRNMLKDAGFLLLQDLGKQYQFAHLTFQEYFAGRWLAKQVLSREGAKWGKAESFFAKYKYAQQFRETFSFMAGEVSRRRQLEEIKQVLKLVDAKPRDIVGVQHVLLQVRLLHEWLCVAGEDLEGDLADLEGEFHVFESLKGWFQVGLEGVRRETEWGKVDWKDLLEVLATGLLQSSPTVAVGVPSLLEPLLSACKDSSCEVRDVALETLGKVAEAVPCLPPALVEALFSGCKDSHSEVALEALGKVVKVLPGLALDLFEPLLSACKDLSCEVRDVALETLGKVAEAVPRLPPALVEALFSVCKHPHSEAQVVALDDLGKVVEVLPALSNYSAAFQTLDRMVKARPALAPALVGSLLNACKDSVFMVRKFALSALGRVVQAVPDEQAPALVQSLLSTCKDSSCEVRLVALDTLGRVVEAVPGQAPDLVQPVLSSCKDSHGNVRVAALETLVKIVEALLSLAPAVQEPLLNARNSNWEGCCDALRDLGKMVEARPALAPALVGPLLNACKKSDCVLYHAALRALGGVAEAVPGHAPALIPPLFSSCENANLEVCVAVLQALGKVVEAVPGHTSVLVQPLFWDCRNANLDVRVDALLAIGKVVEAMRALVLTLQEPLLNDSFNSNRECFYVVLRATGKWVKAVPHLTSALVEPLLDMCKNSESHTEVRRAAVSALGRVVEVNLDPAPSMVEPLINACKDSKWVVRHDAVSALGRVVEVNPDLAPGLVEVLHDACKDPEDIVRYDAVSALGRVVEVNPDLAPGLVEVLHNACKDPEDIVRYDAVSALGRVVEVNPDLAPGLVEVLHNACKDPEYHVRYDALYALGRVVKVEPGQAPVLVEVLLNACKDSDSSIRVAALDVVGDVVEAVPGVAPPLTEPLLKACKNLKWIVRRAARESLRMFSPQQCMDGFWVAQNQSGIPITFANRFFKTALTVQNSPKPHHKRLVLYPTAGEVVKWDKPQTEVQHFIQQIQRAAKDVASGDSGLDETKAGRYLRRGRQAVRSLYGGGLN